MQTLIISAEDIKHVVTHVGLHRLMDEMIGRLLVAFKAYDKTKIQVPMRAGFHYASPHSGLIEWMPAMEVGKAVTVKTVGYHPQNPQRFGLPTILSTVSFYDTSNGHLLGLADATFLTALRTGAASALGAQFLARAGSTVVGLIGAGAQAVAQLHAMSRVVAIEDVFVYDMVPEVTRTFLERVAFLGLKVHALPDAASLQKALAACDILCTATSVEIGKGPVFHDADFRPWLHVNAVGSDFPGKFEVPYSLLARSFVCPDFREQAVKEGECQQLSEEQIGPNLYEVIQNSERSPLVNDRLTVFDSTGWALEDVVAMEMLLAYATELNVGKRIRVESISADPHDPYRPFTSKTANKPAPHRIAAADDPHALAAAVR